MQLILKLLQHALLMLAPLLYAPCCAAHQADAEQPVQIQSSYVEFDDKKGTAIYTGNVIADQGSRHLTADKLTIVRGENNKIKCMIALGDPAYFQSQADPSKPIGFGNANKIEYFPIEDKVDLIGNAKLEQNGDIITGHFLTYFFKDGLLKSNPTVDQRTTVILQPKQKNLWIP